MHPLINGQSFFSRVEVFVDGHAIPSPNTGEGHFLFQNLNRTFCTQEFRNRKFDYEIPRVKNNLDHDNNSTASAGVYTLTTRQTQLSESINANAYTDPDNVTTLGFDCCFPLSSQSTILEILEKKNVETPFLRPGVRVEIRLWKRDVWHALIQKPLVKGEEQFKAAVIDPEPEPKLSEYKLFLKSVEVSYESWTPLTPGPIQEIKHYGTVFYSDLPYMQTQHLTPEVNTVTQRFSLPPKTKACFFSMLPAHHMTYTSSYARQMSPATSFPETLRTLRFFLDGKPISAYPGFTKPAKYGYLDPGCRSYHNSLIQQKLYDSKVEDMVPKASVIGYEQTIVLDLTNRQADHETILEINFDFSDFSPTGWMTSLISLKQVKHTCKNIKEDLWEWKSNQDP